MMEPCYIFPQKISITDAEKGVIYASDLAFQ